MLDMLRRKLKSNPKIYEILKCIRQKLLIANNRSRLRRLRISEKGIYVGTGVRVLESEKIDIGVRTVISDCVTLDGRGGIKIGTGCIISRGVKILTASHDYKSSNFELILKSVEIGDQVWLAEDCKIMPGTRIGNRCVVGAGVILAENLADDEVVTINKRFKKLKEDVMDKNTGFKLIGFKF